MGIQINGQTDTVTAIDGSFTIQGASGNLTGNVTGDLTGNVTGNLTGNVNATGVSTFSGGIQVGATTSIVVGDSFINSTSIGVGTTTTAGRNAGVGTVLGTLIFNSTNNAVEGYFGSTDGWVTVKGSFLATGGTIVTTATSKYHVFISPGSFNVTLGSKNTEVLVIGGGGGGSDGFGSAGGGAGSVVYATAVPVIPGNYSVTVGYAGTGANSPGTTPGPVCVGGDGGPSSIALPSPIIALGGGGGGSGHSSDPKPLVAGRPGGSGGGGGYYGQPDSSSHGPNPGGTGTAPPTSPASQPTASTGGKSYQNDGGAGWFAGAGNIQLGGGGGGAGGAGGNFNPPRSYGGPGQAFPNFPAPVLAPAIPAPIQPSWTPAVGPTGLFAGGGGGAYLGGPYAGGPGGGGSGSPGGGNGTNGIDYTGSGGGAAAGPTLGGQAGTGGAGVVIVYYPTL